MLPEILQNSPIYKMARAIHELPLRLPCYFYPVLIKIAWRWIPLSASQNETTNLPKAHARARRKGTMVNLKNLRVPPTSTGIKNYSKFTPLFTIFR